MNLEKLIKKESKNILVHTIFIVVLVLTLLPVAIIVLTSFVDVNKAPIVLDLIKSGELFNGRLFTVENYYPFLKDSSFTIWLMNSLIVAGSVSLVCGIIGIFSGYAFSRFDFPLRKAGMTWTLIAQLFPLAMVIVPLLLVLFIVKKFFGLEIMNSLWGLCLVYSATALPFSIWMMKGYFDTIPRDLEEAAEIDGANILQRLFTILIPLARPAIATTVLFNFIVSWNEYAIALYFLNKEELFTLPVGIGALLGSRNEVISQFCASAVMVSIPVIILYVYLQKHLISGLLAGSVKG